MGKQPFKMKHNSVKNRLFVNAFGALLKKLHKGRELLKYLVMSINFHMTNNFKREIGGFKARSEITENTNIKIIIIRGHYANLLLNEKRKPFGIVLKADKVYNANTSSCAKYNIDKRASTKLLKKERV